MEESAVNQGDLVERYLAVMWREYHRSGASELRACLIEYYHDLVGKVARRIHARMPRQVQLQDLISAGTFGLIFAIGRYDPARRVKFQSYAGQPIRGSILDYLRSIDHVPRGVRTRDSQIRHAQDELTNELGRPPSENELRERLGLERSDRPLKSERLRRIVSLTPSAGASDSREISQIPAGSETPLHYAIRQDLKEAITRGLSRAERLIILLYYYEQMSMREIGQALDLSESRVSQMHSSIIARLRAGMSSVLEQLHQT